MPFEGNAPERENKQFIIHNDPAHRSVLDKNLLAKNNVTILEHPHTLLTWLGLLLPVPSTEISTEGRHFCDATDII
jgi:hypothetical protein